MGFSLLSFTMTLTEEMHKGEKILKTLKPSPWAYFGWYFLGVILLFAFFSGIIIIILAELVRRGNTYYITDKRVIHEFTFLSRKISSCTYDKIQDIHLTQSLVERIVGVGTVHINTAGTHFIEIRFRGVKEPVSIKRMIEEKIMK